MILEALTIPCPQCLVDLEVELLKVPADAIGVGQSVFCPHRGIALTTCVSGGVLVHWQLWPCRSAEELGNHLAAAEAAVVVAAVSYTSKQIKH